MRFEPTRFSTVKTHAADLTWPGAFHYTNGLTLSPFLFFAFPFFFSFFRGCMVHVSPSEKSQYWGMLLVKKAGRNKSLSKKKGQETPKVHKLTYMGSFQGPS